MKNLLAAVVTTSLFALAAINGCSSDSSSNGTTAGGACSRTSSTSDDDKACDDCMQSQCGAQLAECYGSGYASGNFGGPCGPVIQCQCSCPEGDLGCIVACGSKGGSACETCAAKIGSCEKTKCASACGSSSTPDSGTPPSAGGCENLGTNCCPKISDAEAKQGCEELAGMGDDGMCDQAFDSWDGILCK